LVWRERGVGRNGGEKGLDTGFVGGIELGESKKGGAGLEKGLRTGVFGGKAGYRLRGAG
jgi:hypothetical protein